MGMPPAPDTSSPLSGEGGDRVRDRLRFLDRLAGLALLLDFLEILAGLTSESCKQTKNKNL